MQFYSFNLVILFYRLPRKTFSSRVIPHSIKTSPEFERHRQSWIYGRVVDLPPIRRERGREDLVLDEQEPINDGFLSFLCGDSALLRWRFVVKLHGEGGRSWSSSSMVVDLLNKAQIIVNQELQIRDRKWRCVGAVPGVVGRRVTWDRLRGGQASSKIVWFFSYFPIYRTHLFS